MALQQANTVSWQSAFLGLVPLALNAMTQPSSLDVKLPDSSLLFAARSSPFVCVADALEVLIELCIRICQGHNLHQAARLANWRRARYRLGAETTSLEESAVEKHPKTFLILFIVTLLQAIKILGLEGLFWIKVWAGCYFCSYVVLAVVQILAPENWRDELPPTLAVGEKPSLGERIINATTQLVVEKLAIGCHICVLYWALGQVVHPDVGSMTKTASWAPNFFAFIDTTLIYLGGFSYWLLILAVLKFFILLSNHFGLILPAFDWVDLFEFPRITKHFSWPNHSAIDIRCYSLWRKRSNVLYMFQTFNAWWPISWQLTTRCSLIWARRRHFYHLCRNSYVALQ